MNPSTDRRMSYIPSICILAASHEPTPVDSCIVLSALNRSRNGVDLYSGQSIQNVPDLEQLNLSTVLEDMADKLDVLGRTVAAAEIELRTKPSRIIDAKTHRPDLNLHHRNRKDTVMTQFSNISHVSRALTATPECRNLPGYMRVRILDANGDPSSFDDEEDYQYEDHPERYLLQQNYQSVIPRRMMQGVYRPAGTLIRRLSEAVREAHLSVLTETGKLQVDRAFLQKAIQDLIADVVQTANCRSLLETLEEERAHKKRIDEAFEKEAATKAYIRKLKRDTRAAKRDKITESLQCERFMWSLEDRRQEVIAQKKLETQYVTDHGNLIRGRIKKFVRHREVWYYNKIQDLKKDKVLEYINHQSMLLIVQSKFDIFKDKLNYWLDKYDTDVTDLSDQLDLIKENRENDLLRMVWLRKMIFNYEEICVDDRRLKAIRESKIVRTKSELKACIYIQSWFRGTMVRMRLGPYKWGLTDKAREENTPVKGKKKGGKGEKKKKK